MIKHVPIDKREKLDLEGSYEFTQDSARQPRNLKNYGLNKHVQIDMYFVDVLHPRMLKHAIKDIKRNNAKRSRSEIPKTSVLKMTFKNLYLNKKLRKLNYMHASVDRNLPKLVREDIQNFIDKVTTEGFIFRRVPSVNLTPLDKERVELDKKKR
jgi:hypothetical protein